MASLHEKTDFLSTSWRTKSPIVIVGDGLVGLSTAIFLCKAGYPVILIKREAKLREIGAGIQLHVSYNKVLQELGILDEVAKHAFVTHSIVIYKYNTGKELHSMPLNPSFDQKYGAPHLIIHRADLRRVLAETAPAYGAVIRFGVQVDFSKSDFTRGSVALCDGELLEASLILGADGENSLCREALLGRKDTPRYNGRVVDRVCIDWNVISNDPDLAALINRSKPCVRTWLGRRCQTVGNLLHGKVNFLLNRPNDGLDLFVGPRPVDMDEIQDFVSD